MTISENNMEVAIMKCLFNNLDSSAMCPYKTNDMPLVNMQYGINCYCHTIPCR